MIILGWWIGVTVVIILVISVIILYVIRSKKTGSYIIKRRSEKESGQSSNICVQVFVLHF